MSNDIMSLNQKSINPLTQQGHSLPESITDLEEINSFLDRNKGKKCVVIQGLGFVGAVMSVICANALKAEYAVIGIDLPDQKNYWKIKAINDGDFPLIAEDPKIEFFFRQAINKNNLYASYDPQAYGFADIIIVDINLDVNKSSNEINELISFDVNLGPFKNAIETIGKYCKEDVLVIIETTVPPGTSEKLVFPLINECLRSRGLSTQKWKLGHSYERVMPGPNYIDSIQNFYRVYAGINDESAKATEQFLKTIIRTDQFPLTRLDTITASEMAKVLENSYRAMNISFMVEWSRFAEEAGVNLYDIVHAIRKRPTHKNLMLPGIGVGGYCLTKDPLLASWARQHFFEGDRLESSEKGVIINDKMPHFAFEFLSKQNISLSGAKILLLGVSYREDVGDTRSSPVETFYNCLQAAGSIISIHDPHVNYWEEKGIDIIQNLNDALSIDYDVIVISTKHSVYKGNSDFLSQLISNQARLIYDTVGLFNSKEIEIIKSKKLIKVLGRGDI